MDESACELEAGCSPMWHHSFGVTARKLDFSSPPQINIEMPCSPAKTSPPCRPFTLRTLSLTDNPTTPFSIFHNSGRRIAPTRLNRFSAPNLNPFTPEAMRVCKKRSRSACMNFQVKSPDIDLFDVNNKSVNNNRNINNNNTSAKGEHEEDLEGERPSKRIAIIESKTGLSRYLTEFEEKQILGTGYFGSVFLCTNRMDGCDYAIKKSNKPIAGSANERRALNEVFAHAVLGKHDNVVRYFTAWAEDKHMLIQNEYCNGGSLQDVIEANTKAKKPFNEQELRQLIYHIAEGLKFIHAHKLAHLDIKPSNIFITKDTTALDQDSDDNVDEETTITYKIGDLGHVTSTDPVPENVEEGDSRYLAQELLCDKYDSLTKADIFALGLTAFEAGGGGSLPKNGKLWSDYRTGKIPQLKHLSKSLNDLIRLMTDPDPKKRPTATEILNHPGVSYSTNMTREELEMQLIAEKNRAQILEKKLKDIQCLVKSKYLYTSRNKTEGIRLRSSNPRILGKNCNRSHSTTEFGW